MRTTVLLNDKLIEKTKELTGQKKVSQAVNTALEDYVRRASQLRLAQLGGSYEDIELSAPPRRRIT